MTRTKRQHDNPRASAITLTTRALFMAMLIPVVLVPAFGFLMIPFVAFFPCGRLRKVSILVGFCIASSINSLILAFSLLVSVFNDVMLAVLAFVGGLLSNIPIYHAITRYIDDRKASQMFHDVLAELKVE